MNDDTPIALLDDAGKHSKGRWQARISIREDVNVRALEPSLVDGSMDSVFHVCTVEINRRLHVGERSSKKKKMPICKWTPRKTQNLTGNPGHPIAQDTTSRQLGTARKDRGQQGTNGVKDPVNVECGVDQDGCLEYFRPEVTFGVALDVVSISRQGKSPLGRVLEVLLEISRIMARLVPLVEVAQECLAIAGQLEIKDE